MTEALTNLGWQGPIGALVGLVMGAFGLALVLRAVSGRRVADTATVLRHVGLPLLGLGLALGLRTTLPGALDLSNEEADDLLRQGLSIALIVFVGWSLIGGLSILHDLLDHEFDLTAQDNLEARRIHTRFDVLRRVLVFGIVLLCGIAVLMTFPGLRTLGTSLLASAGIVGIVVGLAVRPTVESMLAGVQVAWTQPIRLDDVVVIDGEWGRIEEIRMTYVVVRIWDQRRLVVPLTQLFSKSFQNWTRTSSALLGAVTVEVDYRTPVSQVREAVGQMLLDTRWNREFWNLQVVEAGERTIRLRVLLTARNADEGWDLRCEIREKLVTYLQEHHPDCLPRLRAEIAATPSEG